METCLDDLEARGIDLHEVFAVAPVRDVTAGLRSLESMGRRTRRGLVHGTIHTAQGKERDIVFLVLGGAPDPRGSAGGCM